MMRHRTPEEENALTRVKDTEQMICVTVFPAAATFRCLKIAGLPVTTNFTLTHWIAAVHFSLVFQWK